MIVAFQKLEKNGYETLLKFRINNNGNGEFFDIKQGYAEKYLNTLNAFGVRLKNGKTIYPVKNPIDFIKYVAEKQNNTYERWIIL